MKRPSIAPLSLVVFLAALAHLGCSGADPAEPDADESEAEISSSPTFQCVSSTDAAALGRNTVFRVALKQRGAKWSVAVREGYLFAKGQLHAHDGAWTKFSASATGGLGEGGWFFAFDRGSLNLNPVEIGASGDIVVGPGTIDGKARTFTCFRPGFARAFAYDATTGSCKNAKGETGRNDIPLAVIRETKNGECTAPVGELNDSDLGYPSLEGWDLAGADLSKATLHFAGLSTADLRGAQLHGMSFGYAEVAGTIDAFTHPPSGCTKTAATIDCHR